MKSSTKIWVGCLMGLSLTIGTGIGILGWANGEAMFLLFGWFFCTFIGISVWSTD